MIDIWSGQFKSFAARFFIIGATMGPLVGICEAALLYSRPQYSGLLSANVGDLIWFLTPLVDLLVFGLLGLALGLAADIRRPPTPWRIAFLAGTGIGAVGACILYEVVRLLLRAGEHWSSSQKVIMLITTFVMIVCAALLGFRIWWNRLEKVFDPEKGWPLGKLAKTIVVATLTLLLGLTSCYFIRLPSSAGDRRPDLGGPRRKPNFVLISLDAVRADHFSSYGYNRPTTPNLDRLARQGVLFENAVAPSSWTLASHASVFTGLLPHQHGADFAAPLAPGSLTLAHVLKSRGYETAGFNANPLYGLRGWGIGEGFETYDDGSSSLRHNFMMTRLGALFQNVFYFPVIRPDRLDRQDARDVNQEVMRWFRHRSGRPFFLFINYFDAHSPYLSPFPYNQRFGQSSYVRVSQAASPRNAPLSEKEQRGLVANYDNCLSFLDEQVGGLLRFLAGSPEWPNTVVLITADHGEGFGEHGHYEHSYALYWELLHVPFILVGRGIPADLRVSELVSLREIFPTLVSLTGGYGAMSQHSSLQRFWSPGAAARSSEEGVISEVTRVSRKAGLPAASISLMTSEWHYIYDANGRSEVYHWPTDPLEETNLASASQLDGITRSLHQKLDDALRVSHPPWPGVHYVLAFPPEIRRSLLPLTYATKAGQPNPEVEEELKSLPYP